MKNNLWRSFALFAVLPTASFAQAFSITGHLRNIRTGRVYLLYAKDGHRRLDSAGVHNGTYLLKGETTENQSAVLLDVSPAGGARPSAKDLVKIYLTPGTFTVSHVDSWTNVSFTGSPVNTEYKKIQDEAKPYNERQMALVPRYRAAQVAKDDAGAKHIEEQFKGIQREVDEKVYAPFVRHNPGSTLALFLLEQYASDDLNAEALQPLFDGLSATIRHSKAGIVFQQRLTIARKTSIGRPAPDFTQNDTLGKPVTLSSFRGKYVLLDFWASWCGPCRAENPNVVKAYDHYHRKGFEILSVSLDRPGDRDKWLNAIHADHLAWTQVSDLAFWNNAIAKEYGISSIPQNFLIDPQGKIVARNLRGDELGKKMGEIYKD